jgi:hypothetical protein
MNGPSVFVAVATTLLLVSRKMKDTVVGIAPGLTIAIEVKKAARRRLCETGSGRMIERATRFHERTLT